MIFSFCPEPPAPPRSSTHTTVSYTIQGEDEPYQPDVPQVIQRNFVPASSEVSDTLIDIERLRSRGENWNGYDMAAPNPASIRHAQRWIKQMHQHASNPLQPWVKPHVGADGQGDVTLEWWMGERRLTIFITPDAAEYLKSWGVRMFSEMEDGDIRDAEECRALWNWLHNR